MQNKKLQAALKYHEMGFSIIPTKPDKKPHIRSWKQFQTQRPDEKQIREWWKRWPNANPAVVCGEISGVNVLDVDTAEGWENLNENYLDESFLTPISRTPGGGYHIMFDYQPGLSNGVRILPGCDLRTDGGYAILPRSTNGKGKVYAWLPELHILKVKPRPMPDFLFSVLEEGSAGYASAPKREHINKDKSLYKNKNTSKGLKSPQNEKVTSKRLQATSTDFKMFKKGSRDNSLFHVANCLIKGGMKTEIAREVLKTLALQCDPPFSEKEAEIKIQSALQRKDRKDRNLAEEVRDFVVTSSGWFLTSDGFNRLQVTSRQDKKAVVLELLRLKDKGIIERHGNRDGCYRRIESDCQPEPWQDASTDTIKLWLPFGLDEMAIIPPGSIITIAGEPNSGKTAALLNIAKENRQDWNTHYFSSETGPGAFKRRVSKFSDITPKQFNINFYQRTDNFADVVKPGEGNLNIVDFLELYSDFYLVSKHLADIHKRLDSAIAIVALQKSPGQDVGRGGSFSIEKPVLSLSLGAGVAKIVKLKEWSGEFNPNRMQYLFKLVDGCRFIKSQGWHHPIG